MKVLATILFSVGLLAGQADYARQDALAFKAYYFSPLDTVAMAQYWSTISVHSEQIYNGDGSWGLGYADWPTRPYDAERPLVRVVARHVLGLLALLEQGMEDSALVYRTRLSLDWLRERQTAEGAWPLYSTNRGVVSARSTLPTTLAATAMTRAYRVLKNPRYAISANQAFLWINLRPQDDSPYHHGLVLSALMEHYRTHLDNEMIAGAVKEANAILSRQLPNGSWSDPHPLLTDEHALVTLGLLRLEQLLVHEHPARRRISGGATAAVNFLLSSQQRDGNFGRGASELAGWKVPTLEILALIAAREVRGMPEFDAPITGAIRALGEYHIDDDPGWRANQGRSFQAMAEAITWFMGRPSAEQKISGELAGPFQSPVDTTTAGPGLAVPDSPLVIPIPADSTHGEQ